MPRRYHQPLSDAEPAYLGSILSAALSEQRAGTGSIDRVPIADRAEEMRVATTTNGSPSGLAAFDRREPERVSDLQAAGDPRPQPDMPSRLLREAPRVLAPRSVAVVMGTRPEAIKLSEVIRLLGPAALPIHTGQHYSDELWSSVAAEVGLPESSNCATVGGRSRAEQIGLGVCGIAGLLRESESVRAVLVHGDTNATLAGALAANAEGLALFHVEAGLRSRDRGMPEEHNRVLVDHLANMCFAPTRIASSNLLAENIDPTRIQITGNTIVEVVQRLLPALHERIATCEIFGVKPGRFVLATLHRPENADNPSRLAAVLDDLRSMRLPVILPLHPRTRKAVPADWLRDITVVDPAQPTTFLSLLAEAALIVSDSGGIQEEATVLQRPALIVRQSTERPEALGRWCELAQPGAHLRRLASERLADVEGWRHRCRADSPYGDGLASRRIVHAVSEAVASKLREAC